jgi:Ca2+-transporting ATPase
MKLRDNDVNKPSSSSSAALLSPVDSFGSRRQHNRNRSWASSLEANTSDGTDSDIPHDILLNPLRHIKSVSSDNTRVDRSRSHSPSKSPRSADSNSTAFDLKGKRSEISPLQDATPSLLPQDIDSDPAPFAFKPYQLAQMLDPKNIPLLHALGGVDGLLLGLGSNAKSGIQSVPSSSSDEPGAGFGASQRHSRHDDQSPVLPGIIITAPEGYKQPPDESDSAIVQGPAFSASIDDRRRVYGHNILPQRSSKSLLSLMISAMKDKVLVTPCFTVLSSSLYLFVLDSFIVCRGHLSCTRVIPGSRSRSNTW